MSENTNTTSTFTSNNQSFSFSKAWKVGRDLLRFTFAFLCTVDNRPLYDVTFFVNHSVDVNNGKRRTKKQKLSIIRSAIKTFNQIKNEDPNRVFIFGAYDEDDRYSSRRKLYARLGKQLDENLFVAAAQPPSWRVLKAIYTQQFIDNDEFEINKENWQWVADHVTDPLPITMSRVWCSMGHQDNPNRVLYQNAPDWVQVGDYLGFLLTEEETAQMYMWCNDHDGWDYKTTI